MATLAIEGGSPVRTKPLPHWPVFAEDEIEAVSHVLKSGKVNYWTGDEARQFEREFAEYIGATYAVAVANGTVGLDYALRALDIRPGDEVVVTPRSFVASASSVVLMGATPVFADVDVNSQNITAESIAPLITAHTKAILVVHLFGWPCDMDSIMSLAAKHGLKVIEDCAQAHGAKFRNRSVGTIGHVSSWSFCQDKIMTTGGEGGMVTTNDSKIWRRIWEFKDHGKSWDAVYNRKHPPGFQWYQETMGTNGRMTEMQAAIGRQQLKKLADWSRRRAHNAITLAERLCKLPALRIPLPGPEVRHAWYKFHVFLRPEMLQPQWSRDAVTAAISAEGIPAISGICPEIYLEKSFRDAGLGPRNRLPNAKMLGETSIQLRIHPTLTEQDLDDTARAVEKVMARATKISAAA